jgi:hypothetical protein
VILQKAGIEDARTLASTKNLPILPADIVDSLTLPSRAAEAVAGKFLPFLPSSARPPANGISLIVNVTEVREMKWCLIL